MGDLTFVAEFVYGFWGNLQLLCKILHSQKLLISHRFCLHPSYTTEKMAKNRLNYGHFNHPFPSGILIVLVLYRRLVRSLTPVRGRPRPGLPLNSRSSSATASSEPPET